MTDSATGGLVRPDVSSADAEQIALQCYGIVVTATELGSNQDRNFVLREASEHLGTHTTRSVLRVDHPVVSDAAREAQHAALDAYRAAGVAVPTTLPGLDGQLTQWWNGFAVRRSEFVEEAGMADAGYLASVVLTEFGTLAATSVRALADLKHPGLHRDHMWDMRVAFEQTVALLPSVTDEALRERIFRVATEAQHALEDVADALPEQAIHGDVTDDNVMGLRGDDSRLHPHTIIDLGDLSYGWRVAELSITLASLLQHEPDRPLRVLETIEAFHREVPLTEAEIRAVWPLVNLRAALLVASGYRQIEIDGGNEYAHAHTAGERLTFESATRLSLTEMTEHVLARLEVTPTATTLPVAHPTEPLRSVLPGLTGEVRLLDPGVESDALDAGAWLNDHAEARMLAGSLGGQVQAVVFPYGVYRMTLTAVDSSDALPNWPTVTEMWIDAGQELVVTTPTAATVLGAASGFVTLSVGDGWLLIMSGLQTTAQVGATLEEGAAIGALGESTAPRPLHVRLVRQDALRADTRLAIEVLEQLQRNHDSGQYRSPTVNCVAPDRVPAWTRLTHDPATLLGLEPRSQSDEAQSEQRRRDHVFASAQERYYETPMQIQRGWRHHLIDTTGRSYVDMVNNVAGLGHSHPGVADAASQQIRTLSTNSRFLYRELAEYSERLIGLLPERENDDDPDLDTVLLVNSGSEAVDLALQLAQAATGRETIVSLREAYHGWTMGSDGVTTSAYDNPQALATRPSWVHIADVPNRFRGTYRGEADDPTVGHRYATDLNRDLQQLADAAHPVAGFLCESVLGNAGGVVLPQGYLAEAYAHVRAAGGLCIADEVQVGFGRMGSSFWGFEQSGVRPDIITIAKPMGNGFPIGGVLTSKRIADALASRGQFFSSTGGNPLSCQVGLAVLDAMETEGLQQNAHIVGARLAAGFRALAAEHEIVGPVHGLGLYLGVELVRDRETMEPADVEAEAICERLRELGVVVQTTSERSNVLKIKPPLCLTEESADFVVAMLDRVLRTGW
ncbi:MAG: aminotransferase [Leucobacter sp.]